MLVWDLAGISTKSLFLKISLIESMLVGRITIVRDGVSINELIDRHSGLESIGFVRKSLESIGNSEGECKFCSWFIHFFL